MSIPLAVSAGLSVAAYFVCKGLIPQLSDMFLRAGLAGKDMSKKNQQEIPESIGLVTGAVYLVLLFIFIPFPFSGQLLSNAAGTFRHDEFVEFIAALLSICCMVLLGFADDVLNLRWRHKLMLPTIATLPLLMVYYVNFNSTTVILPPFARAWLGSSVDIGCLYYAYMASLAVFCTNAINILAGINGLEVGQSLIIAASIVVFNLIETYRPGAPNAADHVFSLYLLMPYLGTTAALWHFNKYPSRVFVGDTFCYLSGMTFAVVGILGHFSKTVLLFFLPQIINFVYSVPQLFHWVPCPRHRLPKYNVATDRLENSVTKFKLHELSLLGRLSLRLLRTLRLIRWEEKDDVVVTNNFTLINLFILLLGPQHEGRLTSLLCGFQVLCSVVALVIRYPLATYFYEK